jgi:NADPH:quinone reductase-like Zn-dependent oxidoreductase
MAQAISTGSVRVLPIVSGVDLERIMAARSHGTAAEYIVLPSAQAVPLPANIGYAEGACFGIPALTALQAVRLAELTPGSTVMVVGGAGSCVTSIAGPNGVA